MPLARTVAYALQAGAPEGPGLPVPAAPAAARPAAPTEDAHRRG